MRYYLYRVRHSLNYKIAFMIVFVFMNLDLMILKRQMPGLDPNFSTFLAGSSLGHYMQMLILWLLPAYLMLGVAGWFHIDEKNKTSSILTTRLGKKKYLKDYIISTFLTTFFLFFINFLINYAFAFLLNQGNVDAPMVADPEYGHDLYLQLLHPILTNFIIIIMTSLFISVYAVFMGSLSFVFNKASYVFLLSFSLWFVLISGNYSILLAFQPFCEFSFTHLGSIYAITTILICMTSMILYILRVKKDEI